MADIRGAIQRSLRAALVIALCAVVIFSPYCQLAAKFGFFAAAGAWIALAFTGGTRGLLRRLVPATPVNKAIGVFFFTCFLSIVFSDNPHQGQKIFFARYVWYAALFWIGAGFIGMGRHARNVFTAALLLAGTYMGAGGIYDLVTLHPTRLYTVFGRLVSFHMLPLFLSYFFLFSFALVLFAGNRYVRLAAALNSLLLAVCLVMQESRAAWVAVAVCVIALSFIKSRKAGTAAVCGIILLFAAGFFRADTRQMLKTIPFPSQWNYRVPLYNSALAIYRDYPVTGAGIGMYQLLIKDARYTLPPDYPVDTPEFYLHAHNIYFELLAEMGTVGLLGFLGVFAAFFARFRRISGVDPARKPLVLGAAAVVVATLIYGVSGSIILVGASHALIFWVVFGIAAGTLL